jgi:hypothetical protein
MERYGISPAAGGYFNAASTYNPLNVTIGTTGIAGIISAGFSGATSRNEYYAVYIDYNRNGLFTDAGEKVAGQTAMTNGGNYNFTVNIPSTATPGITAIRVVMLRQPTAVAPCLTGNRGETNDFYLNLIAPTAFSGEPEMPYVKATEEEKAPITVGPNPSTGKYNVTFNGGFSPVQYDVINTSGHAVKSAKVVSAKILQLDITSMPAGLYLLRLTDRSGKTEMLKLVKE